MVVNVSMDGMMAGSAEGGGITGKCLRNLILLLSSANSLNICLVFTSDTPVADMRAHSPPLSLITDHVCGDFDVREDEEGLLLALKQCDRVRRVHLQIAIPNLWKLVMAINEESQNLEYLIIVIPSGDKRTILKLFESLQARRIHGRALC